MIDTHELRAVFNVERLPYEIWHALQVPDEVGETMALKGTASLSQHSKAQQAVVLERHAHRLLRARFIEPPYVNSELEICIDTANAAGWPTRITLSQIIPTITIGDTLAEIEACWRYTVSDLKLELERGIILGPERAPMNIGANFVPGDIGLMVQKVRAQGPAGRCGLEPGDLLIAVNGARILDLSALTSVLALLGNATELHLSWARGRVLHIGSDSRRC